MEEGALTAPEREKKRWWLSRARDRWWIRWPMDIAVLVVVFWVVGRFQSRDLLADDGSPAPDFALEDLDGETHHLSDYRGHEVLLVFWSPWCTVCHVEADNWARVQAWNDDVRVLAVVLSAESEAEVREFVGEDHSAYPVLKGTADVARDYKVSAFPTHYIIDEEGRIAWQGVGYSPTLSLWLRLL